MTPQAKDLPAEELALMIARATRSPAHHLPDSTGQLLRAIANLTERIERLEAWKYAQTLPSNQRKFVAEGGE